MTGRPRLGRRIEVRLPDVLANEVERQAALRGLPVAEYLRRVIADAH